MAEYIRSPKMLAKQKSRDTANQIRRGSPKLQEVLRQRCRERMKEKRGELFSARRLGFDQKPSDIEETLTEIVRREISNLTTETDPFTLNIIGGPLGIDEALELENELLQEEEQWILNEYEKMTHDDRYMVEIEQNEEECIICPTCQKATLIELQNYIFCPCCKLKLPGNISLIDFGTLLKKSADSHSMNCRENPTFTLLPENNNVSLYLLCQSCSTLMLII